MLQHYAYTPFVWLLVAPAVITGWIVWRVLRRRRETLDRLFALLMAAVSYWALCYALEISAVDLPTKLFWSVAKYPGVVTIGPAWLAFALYYTGNARWLRRTWLRALLALELISPLAVITNSWHRLWWPTIELSTTGPYPDLKTTWGPLFWLHTALAYSFLLAGLVLYVRFHQTTQAIYRRQVRLVIMAMLVPLLGNVFYLTGILPLPPALDITPFLLSVTGMLVAYALYRYQLLALSPIARRHVIEHMPDGVIVEDEHRRIVDANPSALRFLGLKTDAVVGRSLEQLISQSEFASALLQHMEGAEGEESDRTISLDVNGGRHVFDVVTSELQQQGGKQLGRLVVLHDVTEHKQLQEVLTRMMRMAAHDLRTPLAMAVGALDLLASEPLTEEGREWLGVAGQALRRIEQLVNELLDLERVRAGTGMVTEELDPGALAAGVHKGLAPLAGARNQKFTAQIEPDLPDIVGDRSLLHQALENLLSNAIKFTPEGGCIELRVRRGNGEILFEVEDNGRGIPKEAQEKLFEPFYRVKKDEDKVTGSGLGLSLVKAIIEAHHGRIWVESEPDKGSIFGFAVPYSNHEQG
ncbi:MAG: PAS domain S-box protein [Caldilineae bacterium]|nr:MAG: PAS domain S-box protein [Caldilineae bacterium]